MNDLRTRREALKNAGKCYFDTFSGGPLLVIEVDEHARTMRPRLINAPIGALEATFRVQERQGVQGRLCGPAQIFDALSESQL